MDSDKKLISLEEAAYEVNLACKRIGMLHLAYAKTIVSQLGNEVGEKLVLDAIKEYGKMVGELTKEKVESEGLENKPENFGEGKSRGLPKLGLCEGVEISNDKVRVKNCTMARVWRDYNEEYLGSLYCYIDTAKYMHYNPNYKLIHTEAMPISKGEYCSFSVQETTETERNDFFGDRDWRYLDKELMKGDKK